MKKKKTKRPMTQREFARLGAIARNASLTPEQRKEIARKAAQTKWQKYWSDRDSEKMVTKPKKE